MDEVLGADPQGVITIPHRSRFVDGDHPVGIAIEAETYGRTGASDEFLGLLREERPTPVVDIRPIGLSRMDNDLCAKLLEEPRSYRRSSPMSAIHHHPQPGQRVPCTECRAGEGQIIREPLRCRANASDVAP